MEFNDVATGQKIAGAGAVGTVVGSFLPWVESPLITLPGTDGDGILTLLLGLVILGIIFVRNWSKIEMFATGGIGVLTIIIAGNAFLNLGSQLENEVVEISIGIGLYITLISGVIMLIAGGYGITRQRAPSETES